MENEEDTEETVEPGTEPISKKRRRDSAKHVVGYVADWQKKFPMVTARTRQRRDDWWDVLPAVRHKTKNKFNQSTVWSTSPCTSIRKDCVRRHSISDQHKEAVNKEVYRENSVTDSGLPQAFERQVDFNRSAVKVAMQCLYWLVKHETPHTSNYGSLLKAVEFMGCERLRYLRVGENAKYTSQRVIQEFLNVLGEQIECGQLESLSSSPFFAIMIDELKGDGYLHTICHTHGRNMHNIF